MNQREFSGFGRKRPQLNVPIERLHLDPENPRLPEEVQGKQEPELLKVLYKDFNLDELADSMAENGYFDEEPLVAIPMELPVALEKVKPDNAKFDRYIKKQSTKFLVVEGNRRLAAAMLLVNRELRNELKIKHWTSPAQEVLDDLRVLPVIVYSKRAEVVPYLGVRHIVGIQKWDSYAKARYIAQMVQEGRSLDQIQKQIGDRSSSVRKNYICYKLLEIAKFEFDYDIKRAKDNFSFLLLATGQGSIKRFLGLPTNYSNIDFAHPIPKKNLKNLQNLTVWLFGNGGTKSVIRESRDITNFLSHVVASQEALKHLEKTGNLSEAFDRSDGEEKMLLKYLSTANLKLEGALGIAHRHKNSPEVISEIEKCAQTAQYLVKSVKEKDEE